MAVGAKVHLPHMSPEEYDKMMDEVVHQVQLREHHAARVLISVAYLEGDGLGVIEVCETQGDLNELTSMMNEQMEARGLELPSIQPLVIHRYHA